MVKQPPKLKKRHLTKAQSSKANFKLGARGEGLAVAFLKNKNFQIIDTNIEFGKHEVDIIAFDQDQQELVFFEIKTRRTEFFGDPCLAVSKKKIKSMEIVANKYCLDQKIDFDYRFDVLAVTPGKISHYINITM